MVPPTEPTDTPPIAARVPSSAVHRRLFVVGCSRSGTTLVQRLLAGHPGVHTFPESGLFLRTLGMRGRHLPWTWIGLTLGKERRALGRIVERAYRDLPGDAPALPRRQYRLRSSVLTGVATLDRIALASGCRSWLEKTPRHFLHARAIQRLVPRARVIHVIRDGRDVVASIADRARRHPDRFPRQHDPRYGIAEWNRAIAVHARCAGRPGHVFVFYEDLVAHPERELTRLAHECGLDFHPDMLKGADPSSFVRESETWKDAVAGPIRADRSKFRELFDARHRRRIERALHLRQYGALAESLRQRFRYVGSNPYPNVSMSGENAAATSSAVPAE